MTDAPIAPCSSAAEIEQRAAEWLERRAFGSWTNEDATSLNAWLAETIDHQVAFYRLEFAWNRTERLSVLRTGLPPRSERKPKNWIGRAKLMTAVFVASAFCAGVAYQYLRAPEGTTYVTDVGGRKILTLADGSQIELNTNTEVRVAMEDGARKVWLIRGEAFFQVQHDAAHPFTVRAGDHQITDLGTKFLVRRDQGNLTVSLVEGRARIESVAADSKSQTAELEPGDVARATNTSVSVSRAPIAKLETELGWRRGVLIFHDTTLAAAAAEFNRYNRQQLIIRDPTVARLTVDGTFPSSRVETFARLARDVLGLQVETKGDDIVIAH